MLRKSHHPLGIPQLSQQLHYITIPCFSVHSVLIAKLARIGIDIADTPTATPSYPFHQATIQRTHPHLTFRIQTSPAGTSTMTRRSLVCAAVLSSAVLLSALTIAVGDNAPSHNTRRGLQGSDSSAPSGSSGSFGSSSSGSASGQGSSAGNGGQSGAGSGNQGPVPSGTATPPSASPFPSGSAGWGSGTGTTSGATGSNQGSNVGSNNYGGSGAGGDPMHPRGTCEFNGTARLPQPNQYDYCAVAMRQLIQCHVYGPEGLTGYWAEPSLSELNQYSTCCGYARNASQACYYGGGFPSALNALSYRFSSASRQEANIMIAYMMACPGNGAFSNPRFAAQLPRQLLRVSLVVAPPRSFRAWIILLISVYHVPFTAQHQGRRSAWRKRHRSRRA